MQAALELSRSNSVWHELADRVLAGDSISFDEALSVLHASDLELLDVLSAAYRVRHRYFGNQVQLYFLMNAKSGLCPEDCGYCSQSRDSTAEIPRYSLVDAEKLMDGARVAAESQSRTYCIVIAGRAPTRRELDVITGVVPRIKQEFGLKICTCLGLLDVDQALQLKACGVDRVNHNLNTSESFYAEICSTHTYQDRRQTLEAVREAGLEICSGGIIGMGESDEDVVRLAFELQGAGALSIPINFLIPISGTPLQQVRRLNPRYCLKALSMFRLVNPDRELRIAGGRELHLGTMQAFGLYPANSIFVGDYLTTKGQAPTDDYKMIEDLGFEITRNSETACLT